MLPSHALVALALSSILLFIAPEYSVIIFGAAFIGGILPDIDLLFGEHRKTLHYPVYSIGLLSIGLGIFAITVNVYTIGLLAFLIGLASHGIGDIAGSGLEHRPWERTTDRGIYNHVSHKWIAPRYIVGYDGSKRDFALMGVVSVFVYYQYSLVPLVEYIIGGLLVIGMFYTFVRKHLPDIEIYLYESHWLFRVVSDTFFHGKEIE